MPEMPLGRFVWHELMTTDTAAAREFYTEVCGWGIQTMPVEGAEYTMWTRDGTPIGGMMELPADLRSRGVPSHWNGYISVPEVDGAVGKAQTLGAQVVVPPHGEPTVGRWAYLRDGQGVVFPVFTSSNPTAEPIGAPERAFSWHELATTDLDAAFEFYSGLFGWKLDSDFDMGEFGVYRLFSVEGRQIGGMYRKPDDMPAPPHWLHYVRVPSADEAADRVKAAGGQIMNGPMDVPGGDRVAACMDPQGAAFAVHAPAAAGAGS